MLISTTAKVKWHSSNKKHFVELGYTYTKIGDEFEVDVKDLTKGSQSVVKVKCDYCGKEYEITWQRYLNGQNKTIKTDVCGAVECNEKKAQEAVLKKYGTKSILSLDVFKERIKNTNLLKYGCEYPIMSDVVKDKIETTCLERYGYKNPFTSSEIIDKRIKTCLERYGYTTYTQTQEYIQNHSGEKSCRWMGDNVKHERVERHDLRYNRWRKDVYAKDHYTCQCCGRKSHAGDGNALELNAHHINNWRDNEDLRFDINNGITLCEECHKLFHKIYSKRNNTQEQLDEFLQNHKSNILNEDKEIC